jgi:hypothetical protein
MSKAIGRDNIYREITDKIIAELERGIVPWVQPWTSGKQLCPLGLPVNRLTRRSYSGINILLLWAALEEEGFASAYWLTFKQSIAMGGSVRNGEHGTHVYFADKFVPQKEQQRAKDEGTDPSAINFLKRYTVFNAEQCEGLNVATLLRDGRCGRRVCGIQGLSPCSVCRRGALAKSEMISRLLHTEKRCCGKVHHFDLHCMRKAGMTLQNQMRSLKPCIGAPRASVAGSAHKFILFLLPSCYPVVFETCEQRRSLLLNNSNH